MHPFYGPSARLASGRRGTAAGVLSMVAYLLFWAVALVIVKHEADARFPKAGSVRRAADPAMARLRQRLADGEVDEAQFQSIAAVLRESAPGRD